jgi:hypothetical protein
MCACNILSLLAADPSASHLEPAHTVSGHVSLICARFQLPPWPPLGGQALPQPLHLRHLALNSKPVPGSPGSRQLPELLSGTPRWNQITESYADFKTSVKVGKYKNLADNFLVNFLQVF